LSIIQDTASTNIENLPLLSEETFKFSSTTWWTSNCFSQIPGELYET